VSSVVSMAAKPLGVPVIEASCCGRVFPLRARQGQLKVITESVSRNSHSLITGTVNSPSHDSNDGFPQTSAATTKLCSKTITTPQ
jgi:hypothetical protein